MIQQNNQNDYQESNSIALNLETLSGQYQNLLIQYEQAVANYINYLNQEASQPCGEFNSNSTGINQRCYQYIWQQSGCGAGTAQADASTTWAQGMTLDGLINDSFLWSTMTDYNHRMGCYGNPGNTYIILCVGTDGNLYSRQGLDAPWQRINDDSNGNISSICTGADGQTIICTNVVNDIWIKPSWDAPNWQGPVQNPCCVMSVAQGQDETIVGVGMSYALWSKANLNGNWSQTASPGEWISSICIAPDGSIFAIGQGGQIWKKNSYQNLTSQQWQYQGSGTCCVKSITVAPDGTFIGVGTDDQLYTKASYTDLSTPWQGPFSTENSSCCAVSITTVANPNYNASNYNQASQPNYNIGAQPLTSVSGSTFWGTSGISQNNSATLQECQASCSSTPGCTGATFNPTAYAQPMCWLRGGQGQISPGLESDNAIVQEGQQLLQIVQNINQQLTSVNQQIQEQTNNGQPLYDEQSTQRALKTSNLISQFIQLNKERERISQMVNEYQTLDEQQTEGNITISQKYYSFLLLLGLVIIVIILLYKFGLSSPVTPTSPPLMQTGGELGTNTYYIIFGIVLVILIVKNFSNY